MLEMDSTLSIIQSSAMLVIYEFLVIVLYIFTSDPFVQIFTAFMNIGVDELQTYVPTVQTIYFMIFAIAGVIGILWFIVSTFLSEHEYGMVRY